MLDFKCKRCNKILESYESLRKHTSRLHHINSHDFYVEFYLNGIYPLCKCGCNRREMGSRLKNFCQYAQGYQSKIHNNWGHNNTAILKSAKTRRNQFKNGERTVWNDGLTSATSDIVKKLGEMSTKENNPEKS